MTLLAVAALNSHDAWAVGYTQRDYAVALHWVHRRWRRIPIPGAYQFFPQYVAASSPRDVWIFGYRSTAAGQPWQALRWDGPAWRTIRMRSNATTGFHNGGPVIDTSGPLDVWIGSEAGNPPRGGALLMHWDGRRWQQHQMPVIGGTAVIDAPRGVWASPWD